MYGNVNDCIDRICEVYKMLTCWPTVRIDLSYIRDAKSSELGEHLRAIFNSRGRRNFEKFGFNCLGNKGME